MWWDEAMATVLNPYLSFDGNAREAMQRYEQVFGGTLTVTTFGEGAGETGPNADGTMHAHLGTPTGFVLMASDMPPGVPYQRGNAMAVSLSGDETDTLRGWWEALSDGGEVMMPLERQVWGDEFGMCTDRFGVSWMVNITAAG
jgi:PhnB protein